MRTINVNSVFRASQQIIHYVRTYSNSSSENVTPFNPRRVLLLAKLSKYDFVRSLNQQDDDTLLRDSLLKKGVNIDWLIKRHNVHQAKIVELQNLLKDRGLDVQTVNRSEYSADAVNWADVVVTAGGDGTLLLGASKIRDRKKIIFGINTDPTRLIYRNRIRVKVISPRSTPSKLTLSDPRKPVPLDGWLQDGSPDSGVDEGSDFQSQLLCDVPQDVRDHMSQKVLPVVALNEVYAGETLSLRTSQYDISIDDRTPEHHRSSGVIITTGTGSTSWYKSVATIYPQTVSDVLQITTRLASPKRTVHLGTDHAGRKLHVTGCDADQLIDASSAVRVAEVYNSALQFHPTDSSMAFVVRDPVCNAIYNVDQPRGFAKKIEIRSFMLDAQLVFDGGFTFPFPSGSVAQFSIDPADALCTLQLVACN